MRTISGDNALRDFRDGLTGRYGLDLLRRHNGSLLVQLPVGVGKSRWLDAITLEALQSRQFDLVVVLCPTRRLIEERGPLLRPPAGVRVVNLRPRLAKRCGPQRDARWKQFEAADLGALGRVEICGRCPHRKRCFWPDQYGVGLQGASLIYATQAHLKRAPGFLACLRSWTGSDRMLTLLDESSFVGTPFNRSIRRDELRRFMTTLRHATPDCQSPGWRHDRWLALTEMLQAASTEDLQDAGWRMPHLDPAWACVVQREGLQRHGDEFRFLGYDLTQLGLSPQESRRRNEYGNLQFSVRPYVGDCIIFSGTTDVAFTRFRLGKDLASPFGGYRFIHPQTRWYNLASSIGARRFFRQHLPQVLDFFATLIARRSEEGKRVLLVAKKCFVDECCTGLKSRFGSMGLHLRLLTDGWSAVALALPEVVPIINYGMIGTNLFEDFDAVYCLSGFYVNEHVVNACLQDVTREDLRLPIRIETVGVPRRRFARLEIPDHRYYETARLLQPALEFREHDVVIQAVGRVRPFTKPREVITFQMGALPGVIYDAEFDTLTQARRHFGVSSRRQQKKDDLAARVAALRHEGLTQAEIAKAIGVSERTVRRYG